MRNSENSKLGTAFFVLLFLCIIGGAVLTAYQSQREVDKATRESAAMQTVLFDALESTARRMHTEDIYNMNVMHAREMREADESGTALAHNIARNVYSMELARRLQGVYGADTVHLCPLCGSDAVVVNGARTMTRGASIQAR